jgi:hypothetical protein
MPVDKCPICKSTALRNNVLTLVSIECKRCGNFNITLQYYNVLVKTRFDRRIIGKICGFIRERPGSNVTEDFIALCNSNNMPSVGEKAEKLLLHLAKTEPFPSSEVYIHPDNTNELLGASWSGNVNELNYLFSEYLSVEKQFLRQLNATTFVISPKGWAFLDSLNRINTASKIVFVAMRFNQQLIDTVYEKAIKQAIIDCGYEPKIMLKHDHINKIDDEIVSLIKRSKFIVADFTEQNQGAYYEAGYARGLGLQVISTCNKAEMDEGKLHFDTRQYRTIPWEQGKLEDFKKQLQDCIVANIVA